MQIRGRRAALGAVTMAAVALGGIGFGVARADGSATASAAASSAADIQEYGITRLASSLALQPSVGQVGGDTKQGETGQGEKKEPEEGGEPAKKPHGGWQFAITPYLWAAGVGGDVTTRRREVHVDAPFSDIIDNFEGGGAVAAEAQKGRLGLLADVFWLKLKHSVDTRGIIVNSADLHLDQLMAEGALAYRVTPKGPVAVDLLAGARFWDFDAGLRLTGDEGVERDRSRGITWVDPIVGGRLRAQLNKKLAIFSEGDYGGFDWTSKSTWQFLGGLGLRTGKMQELKLGYRLLSIDHQENDFRMDITSSGPILGYTFGFK